MLSQRVSITLLNTLKSVVGGYSFEVLRAKVLFGTKATVKPRFGEQNFTRMEKITMSSFNNYFTPPALEDGF